MSNDSIEQDQRCGISADLNKYSNVTLGNHVNNVIDLLGK